jgi:HK97 family phage major capsid protein
MTIEELKARLAELQERATALQALADTEKRDLTEEEEAQLETIFADFDKTEKDIKNRERLAAQKTRLSASSRRTAPEEVRNAGEEEEETPPARRQARSGVFVPPSNEHQRNRWGWNNLGDFCMAVKNASRGNGQMDPRLQNAPTTYGSEATGPDGSFAIPPDFRSTILQKVTGPDSLLSRCDQNPTNSNGITFPKDETAPWGTTGVQAYWTGEAAQMTQSKPVLEKSTISVEKLTCLVPVTDELLEDAPALGSFVQRKAGDVMDFKVSDAIVNGNGAGAPLGILASPATVSQAAESSQVADTIHGLNLIKMWARMPAAWRSTAVWLTHPDAEPQLMQAGLQIGPAAAGTATGGQLVWMPPGGISGSPYASLFGRPIIPTQSCQALGDVGDIIFAALPQYAAVLKSGGIKSDSSIHLFFDYNITAFRFTFRMGGQPWWSAPITAKNGSTTYGPFVTLAAR